MQNRTKIAVAIAFVGLVLSFVGCGGSNITVSEAQTVLPELVEKSLLLNELYFGQGFPPDGDAEGDMINGYYYADCTYHGIYSISEIKDLTEEVFTTEYAAILYESAFDGMVTDDTVVTARYIESEGGLMQSIYTTVYDLPERIYNYDSMKIIKKGSDRVTLQIETDVNGILKTVNIILVRTENADGEYVYRLDSPTY